MSEPTQRVPDLEAGLAEIDRRLQEIQDELSAAEATDGPVSERVPTPHSDPTPPPSEPPEPSTSPPAPRRHGRSGPLAAALQRSSGHREEPVRGELPVEAADPLASSVEDLRRQVAALSNLRDRLLASIRELVDGYEAIAHAQPGTAPPIASDDRTDVTLAVGPFTNLDGVRAFERAVAGLPGVRETSLRGYEGADRAIVDVRLNPSDRREASRE